MTLNPDIRDQAYQFFIEEAPELLQVIESGLLTLRQERDTAKVHAIMRAAHSLKGGAASVELDEIKTLAHRLENIFKALYNETIDIDTDLESQLLQAYDCLRLPLMEQITTGAFDTEQALTLAEPIFAQIEAGLGDALTQADNYIPSSSELGVDMALSIFEVDVAQGLEHLAQVIAEPSGYEVAGELRAQAEVFLGFAELLNQPGFGAIAATAIAALNANPEYALEITELALIDFQLGRQAVLAAAASKTKAQVITPCAALVALANSTTRKDLNSTTPEPIVNPTQDLSLIEDVFGTLPTSLECEIIANPTAAVPQEIQSGADQAILEDIFNTAPECLQQVPVAQTPSLETFVELFDTCAEDLQDFSPHEEAQEVASLEALAELFESSAAEVLGNMPLPSLSDTSVATSGSLDQELVSDATPVIEDVAVEPCLIEDGNTQNEEMEETPTLSESSELTTPVPETLEDAVQILGEIFDVLPQLEDFPAPVPSSPPTTSAQSESLVATPPTSEELVPATTSPATPDNHPSEARHAPHLTVRVGSERLERMNNLVGELAINRNGLSLQNDQLQRSVRELLNRFLRVHNQVGNLQELSYQMLVTPERNHPDTRPRSIAQFGEFATRQADFDALELDRYGVLNSQLQELLEDMVQLEESVDDIVLFARATDQTLQQQRQMLTLLRDELMWARMLPLGEVLNRFPRLLRDLSTKYHKSVNLQLSGTSVLVDKAVLEKLYDPLLHLLRNAFDHGIESPHIRQQHGKPEQGKIEIKAYHQGSQTIIEVKDDGQGLNLERIRDKAVELGLLSDDQLTTVSTSRLHELIFEPGFSTAAQVSELSGRGVGLDVVRAQMRSLKGTIAVTSSPGVGTTFTLRLPLTLTIAKLLVCFVGSTALALPSDSVEEIVVPKGNQVKQSGRERFLQWRGQIVPVYRLAQLLEYNCPLPDTSPSKALIAVPSPQDWALPMLILQQEQHTLALEIDRLVTEQELVIKPFGAALAPPCYTYGCTILGDGSLIPVIDGTVLLEQLLGHNGSVEAVKFAAAKDNTGGATINPVQVTGQNSQSDEETLLNRTSVTAAPELTPTDHTPHSRTQETACVSKPPTLYKAIKAPTILIVDDAVALRRTLALTLERAGYQVLQARDGREAIEHLQHSSSVQLVVCDVEMPNMNGFEFLSYRRQDPQLAKIPVAMLTSRSNDKHRWLAIHLGANAYFTKPYLEQEFVTALKELIGQGTSERQSTLQTIS